MTTQDKRLMRLPDQGQIAGVCAGLADYFEIDVTLVRLISIVLIFATGGGMIIVYFVLALAMPVAHKDSEGAQPAAHKSDDDRPMFSRNVEQLTSEFRDDGRVDRARNYAGAGLVALGVWLLAVQFFPQWVNFRWDFIWTASFS